MLNWGCPGSLLALSSVAVQDANGDGRVCVSDFKKTVTATPLLLEAFGRCLPEGQVSR